MTLLNEIHFWDEQRITFKPQYEINTSDDRLKRYTIKQLNIHIVDIPQHLEVVNTTGKDGKSYIATSFGLKYDEKAQVLDMSLYISPNILKSEPAVGQAKRYSIELLQATYFITHSNLYDIKDSGLNAFIMNIKSVPEETFFHLEI
jgi:hypothetical protein